MRKPKQFAKRNRKNRESGQAMILMLLIFAIVLLGAVAFAVDMGMMWYHRQQAQSAADAACVSGAMDILVNAAGAATGNQGFNFTGNTDSCYPGNANGFHCSAKPGAAPCAYAARNGYSGATTNDVCVSFPTAAQMTAVPSAAVPGAGLVPQAFMRVDITDHVPSWFSGVLSGQGTRDVRAFAACGSVLESAPVPIVVLHPTQDQSLKGNGAQGEIKILGGPSKSIEVNSGSTTAVGFGGTIDLSLGGPNYDGSQLGTFGGPATPTGTFLPNPTYWIDHAAPVVDPFQGIAAPTKPALPTVPADLSGKCTVANITGGSCKVDYWKTAGGVGTAHGCPDPYGCYLFTAGDYTGLAKGLELKGKGGKNRISFLFDPGIYYMENGISADALSVIRTSTYTPPAPNNIGGVIFYLTGAAQNCGAGGSKGLVCIDSNSGKEAFGTGGAVPVDPFDITVGLCPGGAIDPNLTAALTKNGIAYTGLNGNLLLGPCTGTYGISIAGVAYRGILLFQDHAQTNLQNAYGGGGTSLAAGSMYFHESSTYTSQLTLQGGSCSGSYILGEIVVDTLHLGGNPCINMVLNPNKTNSILKATLLPWNASN
jgi:Flp pilus assembly protein TadG